MKKKSAHPSWQSSINMVTIIKLVKNKAFEWFVISNTREKDFLDKKFRKIWWDFVSGTQ